MAQGLNKVLLIGNLGADPELKFTQGGQAVMKLRIATTDSFINKAKERQERTEWHQVVVWGPRAEALNKFLSKGSKIYIEGRLQTRDWEDKQGQKRYTTEIVASDIILLGGRGGERGASQSQPPAGGDYFQPSSGGGGGAVDDFGADDDIPF